MCKISLILKDLDAELYLIIKSSKNWHWFSFYKLYVQTMRRLVQINLGYLSPAGGGGEFRIGTDLNWMVKHDHLGSYFLDK